jgi:hypothetical protein
MNKSLPHGFQSDDGCQRAHSGWYQGYSKCNQSSMTVMAIEQMGLAQ